MSARLFRKCTRPCSEIAEASLLFVVGGEDAVKMKPEFAPLFDVKDMINLAVAEFYIKMTIDGESYDPFSAETCEFFRRRILHTEKKLSMLLAENIQYQKTMQPNL